MSNNEFFKMSMETIKEIGSLIDLDNLKEIDNDRIFKCLQELTQSLLSAYGYEQLKKMVCKILGWSNLALLFFSNRNPKFSRVGFLGKCSSNYILL